jgi:alcohol dehydrogenase (cytochrome c)
VLPKPGEPGSETWGGGDAWKFGGGPDWLTGSYDPELNLIYWGTGQANPDFIGDKRTGDNLYTECVVALDADTGKVKWYFQFTPHDVHDWDAVEVPVLVDTQFQGQPRKLLVQANRNGYYYVLDRTNGKFLHGTPFVKSLTWSSGLTAEGRPILVPDKEPTVQGNVICPATAGATNWPSPAYNPDTHYFYAVVTEGCSINYRGSANFQPRSVSDNGTGYIESPDEEKRWQNYVRALDVTTGKLMWEYKQIGSNHYGPGLLSTAGGLLFAGDNQGVLTALDARAGKPLWHFSSGEKITASPMAYSILGNEYVTLVAGPNVIAFGLPDRK